jgi:paraquat-inducible protein A
VLVAQASITITCADCGARQTIPELTGRSTAECHRCDRLLARRTGVAFDVPLACAAAMSLLLPPAVFMPLMYSTIQNLVFEQSRLVSSVPEIYSSVWFPFAFGFLFFALLFPAIRAFLQVIVLASLRFNWRVPQVGRIFRWSEELYLWSMTDVVVIAGIVAYLRADIPADVEILLGAWCYVGVAALAFATERTLDRRAVWSAILPDRPSHLGGGTVSCAVCEFVVNRRSGDPCPRCGATLDPQIAHRFMPVAAAIAAAIPLCLPAYSAAVMVNDQLTAVVEHTIIGTVQLFADRGYWQFGAVILLAGVVVPLAVLAGMLWLLFRVRFPSKEGLVLRTRAYRMMRRLVRWPMILPFVAAIAAPIVDFRGIDDIVAGPGATPLFMLITLLILSIRLFEPRLMWRSAGEAG